MNTWIYFNYTNSSLPRMYDYNNAITEPYYFSQVIYTGKGDQAKILFKHVGDNKETVVTQFYSTHQESLTEPLLSFCSLT